MVCVVHNRRLRHLILLGIPLVICLHVCPSSAEQKGGTSLLTSLVLELHEAFGKNLKKYSLDYRASRGI